MAKDEVQVIQTDTTKEDISKLQKSYDDLYAKVIQLMDELDEKNQLGITKDKDVVAYSGLLTCDANHPGYLYFRIDEDMNKIDRIFVDVHPVDYFSPVILYPECGGGVS